MTEIAFAADYIDDRADRRPLRVAPARSAATHAPNSTMESALTPRPPSGLRAVVESAVGTAFSATVAVVMVTGLAGAGAASAVAGVLRSR